MWIASRNERRLEFENGIIFSRCRVNFKSQRSLRELSHFKRDGLTMYHLLQLFRRQLVELHLEREGFFGNRFVLCQKPEVRRDRKQKPEVLTAGS